MVFIAFFLVFYSLDLINLLKRRRKQLEERTKFLTFKNSGQKWNIFRSAKSTYQPWKWPKRRFKQPRRNWAKFRANWRAKTRISSRATIRHLIWAPSGCLRVKFHIISSFFFLFTMQFTRCFQTSYLKVPRVLNRNIIDKNTNWNTFSNRLWVNWFELWISLIKNIFPSE